MEVVGPDLVLGLVAADHHVGDAAVPPVVDQHAVAGVRHALCQRFHPLQLAPATGRQRHPRPTRAKDLIVDVDTANLGDRHGISSDIGVLLRASPQLTAAGTRPSQALWAGEKRLAWDGGIVFPNGGLGRRGFVTRLQFPAVFPK
jgi:hypothetical protein